MSSTARFFIPGPHFPWGRSHSPLTTCCSPNLESACMLHVHLVRKRAASLGRPYRGSLQRRNHTNKKVWILFPDGKLQVCLVFNRWHHILSSSSLNRLLSTWLSLGQCPGTVSEGKIIRKKCLSGTRALVAYQMEKITELQTNP